MLLQAFIDDSGNSSSSEFFVLVGYLSTPEAWTQFASKWREVLNEEPVLKFFKATHVDSPRDSDVWGLMSPAQRDARLSRFIKVAGDHSLRAFFVIVRRQDFVETMIGSVYTEMEEPYHWLFIAFLKMLESLERHHGDLRGIHAVFDRHDKHPQVAGQLYRSMAGHMGLAGRILKVTFADDIDALPLQAADLIAWQVRRRYCYPDESIRKHYSECLEAPILPPFGWAFTRKELEACRDSLIVNAKRNHLRLVKKEVGTQRNPKTQLVVEADDDADAFIESANTLDT